MSRCCTVRYLLSIRLEMIILDWDYRLSRSRALDSNAPAYTKENNFHV